MEFYGTPREWPGTGPIGRHYIMMTILYLSLGNGAHIDEIAYSVYSAMRFLHKSRRDCRLVVYTDLPNRFSFLPLEVRHVDAYRRTEWCEPLGYLLRAKACVLRDAIRTIGGKCVLIDSDTYFIRSPDELFNLIRPGQSVMHELLGPFASWGRGQVAALLEAEHPTTHRGEVWDLSPYTWDYNSGIVGLDEADAACLEDVLPLCDLFYARTGQWGSEEFAHSACLARGTRVAEAFRIVGHYYHPATKAAFRKTLPNLLNTSSQMDELQRAEWLFKSRPVEPLRFRLFLKVNRGKSLLRKLGLFRKPLRSSHSVAAAAQRKWQGALSREVEGVSNRNVSGPVAHRSGSSEEGSDDPLD